MTQETVAEIAELDRKHISMIETGRAEPRIGTLIRIAGALDLPVESHNGQNPHTVESLSTNGQNHPGWAIGGGRSPLIPGVSPRDLARRWRR